MDEEEVPRFKLVEEVTIDDWVFQIEWEYDRFRADYVIYRANGVYEDGTPDEEWEEEASGHVDWGGCFHLSVDYDLHLCTVSMLKQHCSILKYTYDRGRSLADA